MVSVQMVVLAVSRHVLSMIPVSVRWGERRRLEHVPCVCLRGVSVAAEPDPVSVDQVDTDIVWSVKA